MPGLAPKKRAELLAQRLRPRHQTPRQAQPLRIEPVTALVSRHIPARLPDVAAITRRGDDKGRISWTDAATHLGWAPGPLKISGEGLWLLLQPADRVAECPRGHRDQARFLVDGRIGLPRAALDRLGHKPGHDVLLVPFPAVATLAIASPAIVTLVAPASLVGLDQLAPEAVAG